jgi:hypothetical protein
VAHGETRTKNRRPPPLFIAQCDRDPLAMDKLGAPDQGARSRPKWALGPPGREIKPTFSSLISTYIFDFRLKMLFTFICSITD